MSTSPAPSYLEAHRYDGTLLIHDQRDTLTPCAIQPRDFDLIVDVWRYKFLTATQILELWWPGRAAWAGQRRLRKLFMGGYLERFRPSTRSGSYPWTYHLGAEGHGLLRAAGRVPPRDPYRKRAVYDFGHVLHELQLNAWVLALRRTLGDPMLQWHGETDFVPPRSERGDALSLGGGWSVRGLADDRPRLVRPDAVLEIAEELHTRSVLVEFDRTRRVDKNFDKFRRYDSFLCSWHRDTRVALGDQPPDVLFVCQDEKQLETFLSAADREVTGHHWHPSATSEEHRYVGREHMLFVDESKAHSKDREAWALPGRPPGDRDRDHAVQRCDL